MSSLCENYRYDYIGTDESFIPHHHMLTSSTWTWTQTTTMADVVKLHDSSKDGVLSLRMIIPKGYWTPSSCFEGFAGQVDELWTVWMYILVWQYGSVKSPSHKLASAGTRTSATELRSSHTRKVCDTSNLLSSTCVWYSWYKSTNSDIVIFCGSWGSSDPRGTSLWEAPQPSYAFASSSLTRSEIYTAL